PEPPRRLPLRRRRGPLGVHRRGAAGRLRLPHRRAPARAGDGLRLPAGRRRRPDPARGQGPGVALRRRGPELDPLGQRPAGRLLVRRHAGRDDDGPGRAGGPVPRRPRRLGLRQPRRRRLLEPGRRPPARRAGGPGGRGV
ncbi:MAG: GH74, partial [uncultured Friedmanniella sp.]